MVKRFLDVAPKSKRVKNVPVRFRHSVGSPYLAILIKVHRMVQAVQAHILHQICTDFVIKN